MKTLNDVRSVMDPTHEDGRSIGDLVRSEVAARIEALAKIMELSRQNEALTSKCNDLRRSVSVAPCPREPSQDAMTRMRELERTNQSIAAKLRAIQSAYKTLLAEYDALDIRDGMDRAELSLFRSMSGKPDAADIQHIRDQAEENTQPMVLHRAEVSKRLLED